MKIKSLHLQNFRRFTDLTIQGFPLDCQLVLLIGSNGSGKSSVFDAFQVLNRYQTSKTHDEDRYYNKIGGRYRVVADFGEGWIWDTDMKVFKGGGEAKILILPLYGRTSFRQIPRLNRTQLGQSFDIRKDNDRPHSFIDRDERFENDLEHLFGKLLREFFKTDDEKTEIKKTVIEPINNALGRIFSNREGTKIELVELIPPLEGKVAEINFRKGKSIFHYNLLSAGEKEVFNILINLIARKDYYKGGILYFDEIDLHLSTKLQYNFIKEVVENWAAPMDCQLWTASHSLGFIEYAKSTNHSTIFDFDDYDFDNAKVLTPEPKEKPEIYQIAVDKDFLPNLFKGLDIVFVENKDKVYYAQAEIEKTVFVPENGRNGVYHKIKNGDYKGIVDRDFLTDEDIALIEASYPKVKILKYYSIENYLYHPDNLEEYYHKHGMEFKKDLYIQELIEEKNKIKDELIPSLSLKRTEYPYFGEPDHNGKKEQNRFKNKQENVTESTKLAGYLNSSLFDDFYKVFPMKSHATQLAARQNISKTELSKTDWFKAQVQVLLGQ